MKLTEEKYNQFVRSLTTASLDGFDAKEYNECHKLAERAYATVGYLGEMSSIVYICLEKLAEIRYESCGKTSCDKSCPKIADCEMYKTMKQAAKAIFAERTFGVKE